MRQKNMLYTMMPSLRSVQEYSQEVLTGTCTEIPVASRSVPRSWHTIKRAMDIVIAAVALIVAAPILVAALAAIVLISPGPPIFAQTRVGKNGRRFRMLKLRTMIVGAHLRHQEFKKYSEVAGPVFKMRKDPRLHMLGGFLRRWSIDEVPNLVNVLRGEMSIVGPRPPLPCEVEDYDAYAMRRLTVKPGITCLWQVSGRSNVSFDDWMRLDNEYVDTWSPRVDCAILLRTIPAVLSGTGAH
jgi:lipopolysaccharide/colanic/teichoic acid biosynthesis glycosyltransferase